MQAQKIAIVGLGRIGSAFLTQMLQKRDKGIDLVCAAETHDTPGRKLALDAGVTLSSLDQIVARRYGIDIVFDLTGLPDVRRTLRDKQADDGNRHTIIACESIVRVMW